MEGMPLSQGDNNKDQVPYPLLRLVSHTGSGHTLLLKAD